MFYILCHILMFARWNGGDRERGDPGQPGLVPQAAGAATDLKVQRKKNFIKPKTFPFHLKQHKQKAQYNPNFTS